MPFCDKKNKKTENSASFTKNRFVFYALLTNKFNSIKNHNKCKKKEKLNTKPLLFGKIKKFYLFSFLLPILLSVWLINFFIFSLCASKTINVKINDKSASGRDL